MGEIRRERIREDTPPSKRDKRRGVE